MKEYTFEPYECITIDSIWYVFGYIKAGSFKSFKLNRVVTIELTDQTFIETKTTHSREINDFGYTIDKPIRFKGVISDLNYLEEYIWGDNQSIRWISDRQFEIEVDFNTEYRCLDFIRRASYHCEILEPIWIREQYSAEIGKLYATYFQSE